MKSKIYVYFGLSTLMVLLAECWITLDLMGNKNKTFLEIEIDNSNIQMSNENEFKIKKTSHEACLSFVTISDSKVKFTHISDCSRISSTRFWCILKYFKPVNHLVFEVDYLCSKDVIRIHFINLERFLLVGDLSMTIHLSSSLDDICYSYISSERNKFSLLDFSRLHCLKIACNKHGIILKVSYNHHNLENEIRNNVSNCSKLFQRQRTLHRVKKTVLNIRPPLLNSKYYVTNVLEEQPPGISLNINISATDPDEVNAGKPMYSLRAIKDQRSQELFEINPFTGNVKTTQKLDRESMSVHFFKIVVSDSGKPKMSAEASLTIYVKDVNDHRPKCENNIYTKFVYENMASRSELLTVHAMDGDSDENGEITYSILNINEIGHLFEIDSQYGVIKISSRLDRETRDFYRLKILASDNARLYPKFSSTCIVEVTLQDENDNSPQFTNFSYYFEIEESMDHFRNPIIGSIWACDADVENNSLVRYTITSGNSLGHFQINSINGSLSLVGPLDYESIQSYKLFVRAQDQGFPPMSNTTSVTIIVLDSNDNEPKFDAPYYHNSIFENVVVGSSVLKVKAYDADSGLFGKLKYFMQSNHNLPFMINEAGDIRTINNIDREVQPIYKFEIVACDSGEIERCSKTLVHITIMDINDNSPVFEHKTYNSTIMEDSHPGSLVETVKATDADEDLNGKITYAIISGNDRGSFNLVTQIGYGMLSVARVLNYKEQNQYELTISASDSVFEDIATIYISVLHVNLHRPIFVGTPYHIKLLEDTSVGHTVFNVSAFDADFEDNGRISYFLDPKEVFAIDEVTGVVYLINSLDRETKSGYTLTVTASDHGHPSKLDFADIEVSVVDVNDNPPKFVRNSYRATVTEDAFVGTYILTVHANDADEGINKKIRYILEDFIEDFRIDSSLGTIRIAKELDRERVANYDFIVYAVDEGKSPLTGSVLIKIEVEDVNDNAPVFESSNLVFQVQENIPFGSRIGEIKSFDFDDGLNAHISISILPGLDSDSFSLDSFSNKTFLMSAAEFDFEGANKKLAVGIRARSNHLFTDALVRVIITDVNDNAPVLKDFDIIFNNYKDHFNLGYVGKVPAHDLDASDKLTYQIVYGNQGRLLHLNETTGLMRLDSRLNSDVPIDGTIVISVTDGINEVRATCKFYVRLVTEQMLSNSITIQLQHVDQTVFLGLPYRLLTSALAAMVSSTSDDVCIINIQNDLSKIESKVSMLNISFAIRRSMAQSEGVFFSPEFLKERIHLLRPLLMKLSLLEILPFEDDLCVYEPCLNFEDCNSVLRFGGSSTTISSDSMFFRPIHTISIFTCQCPPGFTGMDYQYLCDTEINFCFSNPCLNNGTCTQTEGGYRCYCPPSFGGNHCEVSKLFALKSCMQNACKSPSKCLSMDNESFRCQICDTSGRCKYCDEQHGFNELCEVISRSFRRGSYLMLPPVRKKLRFNITLSFATKSPDGMLLYNGRLSGYHDFVLLQIQNKQLHFSFSLGSHITTMTTIVNGGVNTGKWIKVTIMYYNRTATLIVGDKCDVRSRLHLGGCASRAAHLLEQRCEDVTEICHRLLDLTGPLMIGGMTNSMHFDSSFIPVPHFTGCISNITIDQKRIDLNSFVSENATSLGCIQKKNFCFCNPCLNGGECSSEWGGFKCDCPNGFVGKNCKVLVPTIDRSAKLIGNSSIFFITGQHKLSPIKLPWFVAFYMKTTQGHSTLFYLEFRNGNEAFNFTIELVQGKIECGFSNSGRYIIDEAVNDGVWHHIQMVLASKLLTLTIDYGLSQTSYPLENKIVGYQLGKVVFGGILENGNENVLNGFKGCTKSIRFGNSMALVMTNRSEFNVEQGCSAMNICSTDLHNCNHNSSKCLSLFDTYLCRCNPGYEGQFCQNNVCEASDLCQNEFTRCVMDVSSLHGYRCICENQQCQEFMPQVHKCPTSWWGSPICGPCNCSLKKGFDPNCDQKSGQCSCKPNHYLRNAECLPCDCYNAGSVSLKCDVLTGQCLCRNNVVGQQCDKCISKMAQITAKGCEVIYDGCPRSFEKNVWWDKTIWNTITTSDCPPKMIGIAKRYCNESNGWNEPDMKNCSSVAFSDLRTLLAALESNNLEINTFVSKDILFRLKTAANVSFYHLASSDIDVTLKLLNRILIYERRQEGLDMTHNQDRNFIQNFVDVVGCIINDKNFKEWQLIHGQYPYAAVDFITNIFKYLEVLTVNMQKLFTPPFDAVHTNFMLGLDWIGKSHAGSYVKIPKFNNKLKQLMVLDFHIHINFPLDAFSLQHGEMLREPIFCGYVIFKHLGIIMPPYYDDKLRQHITPLSIINSSVFHLCMINRTILLPLQPYSTVMIRFENIFKTQQLNPKCVMLTEGKWSHKGCKMVVDNGIACLCNNISTYALITEADRQELNLEPFILDKACYVILILSAFLQFCASIIFFFIITMPTVEDVIHLNLSANMFLSFFVYIFSIERVHNKEVCKMAAMLLHLLWLNSQAWMFAELFHLYQRITDVRSVNHGSTKLLYIIGYVFPGITVSLAVAINTDTYGCRYFCWLSQGNTLFWGFITPMACYVLFSLIVLLASVLSLIRGWSKKAEEDVRFFRYRLQASCIMLILMCLSSAFFILSLIFLQTPAYKYLFIAFSMLQSIFLVTAYIVFSHETQKRIQYVWLKITGNKADYDIDRFNTQRPKSKSLHSESSWEALFGMKLRKSNSCDTLGKNVKQTKKTTKLVSHNHFSDEDTKEKNYIAELHKRPTSDSEESEISAPEKRMEDFTSSDEETPWNISHFKQKEDRETLPNYNLQASVKVLHLESALSATNEMNI